MSLLIGDYAKRSVQVDSTEYSLFFKPEHNYFEDYMNQVGDTLAAVLRDARNDYERKINLTYPFKRFTVVEVPVHFISYPRVWTSTTQALPPEQAWIPELGVVLPAADFKRMKNRFSERSEQRNQTYTDEEIQASMLRRFVGNTFLGENQFPSFNPRNLANIEYKFPLFPQYYSHVIHFSSRRWPIFNAALEGYFYNRAEEPENRRARWFETGLSDEEKVNRALSENSLAGILKTEEDRGLQANVVRMKGDFLFKTIGLAIGRNNLDVFWARYISENRFRNIPMKHFTQLLNDNFNIDMHTFLDVWYESKNLPGFQTRNVSMYQVKDSERIRYQVLFDIFNPETVDGLFEVSFSYGGGGRFRMDTGRQQQLEPPRVYKLAAGEQKRIGIVLNEEPRTMSVNSLVARNIPIVTSELFSKSELRPKAKPFDGAYLLEKAEAFDPGSEYIIDNSDTAFEVFNPPFSSWLKRIIYSGKESEEETFGRFSFWQPPGRWTLIKDASYFGRYVHSAYFISSGKGERKVRWNLDVKEAGMYDVYAYVFRMRRKRFRRSRFERIISDQHFKVFHDDGVDRVTVDMGNEEPGWYYMGSWYFSPGTGAVELSDESSGRVVIADAIRLVKM